MSGNPDDARGRPTLVDRCGDLLTDACLAIAAGSLLCIVAVNGANVVARYLFVSPFSWAEELMLFLRILSVCSGAVAITWRQMHIRIDTFIEMAPPAARQAALAVGTLVAIAAITTVVYASGRIISVLYKLDQRSDALDVPSWIPQSFLTIGLAVTALLIGIRTVQTLLRGIKPPAHTPESGP